MNKEKLKKILNDFEEENFVDSKETMKGEIRKKVNDYLKNKTGVQNDPIDVDNHKEEEEKEEEE